MKKEKKQLFIDISELVTKDARTGIQRVVRSILSELLKNPHCEYVIRPVYTSINDETYFYANQFMANSFNELLAIDGENELKGYKKYLTDKDVQVEYYEQDIFLGLDLQHDVVISKDDFFYKMRMSGVKVYFVVYDLLPVLMPHAFHPNLEHLHHKWLSVLAKQDGVICISKSVAIDFDVWLKKNQKQRLGKCKVSWFHLGGDLASSLPSLGMPSNSEKIIDKLSKNISFLMVGTIEPRKGHEQVLNAFEFLWENDVSVNLVFVGKQGWSVESLVEEMTQHPQKNTRFFWLNGISDEYLEKIYSTSDCLIAASQGEGFGLPLIEAAQKKKPIIARDISVFKEVAGEHAYYFEDQKDPKVISQVVNDWLHLYKNNRYPKSDDMPWLTWKQSAEELLSCLIRS